MTKRIDNDLFVRMFEQAGESTRKRSHHNLHPELTDPVQRLCVALKKGTYIRPHRHRAPKWEMILVLSGSIIVLIFEEDGRVKERINISLKSDVKGIEIPVDTWHTLIPENDDAVILEIKQGPYSPSLPEDYAEWSPEEETSEVKHFLSWIDLARPGDRYTVPG